MATDPMTNSGTCPSLETIGAFVDGRFKDREREVIADHLASCETCYFVFSEAARTRVVAQPQAEVVQFTPRRMTWSIAAGLAAAATIVLAVNVFGPFGANGDERALTELVTAVGTARTFEPRLTGGFAYAPVRGPVRGVNNAANLSPDLRIAIAEIEKQHGAQPVAASAALVAGDADRSIALLEALSEVRPNEPKLLSDLSAAYLARAERSKSNTDAGRGLATANRALEIDRLMPEALFNRALALQMLGMTDDARDRVAVVSDHRRPFRLGRRSARALAYTLEPSLEERAMRLPRRAAIALIGIGVIASSAGACRPATPAPSGRAALASAVSTTLPFQARLSGGFAPSSAGPTRAAGDRAPELSPDTRIAIALLEKRAIEDPTPEALADLGVGYLVQGDVDRAIATIEDAASQMTAAAPWSDLSAAYLAKAERMPVRRVEYLSRALESAEKSLKIARTNDAMFNRALARDGLAPFTGSPAPWAEYAALEQDQPWREAASRLADDDQPVESASDRWDARRRELAARLRAGDREFVRETVQQYPEASLEFLEREIFVDPREGESATMLAAVIYEVTRDPMARDEAAVFRTAGDVIVRAHQVYAAGVKQVDTTDLAGARRSFTEAGSLFSRARAPFRAVTEVRLAAIDSRENLLESAHKRLSIAEQEARSHGYTILLARVLLQRGLVYNRQWQLTEGLAALRESAALYDQSAQRENAVSVYSNIADVLRTLGEPHQSWEFIGRTLDEMRSLRKPLRRYLPLYNAALFARHEDLHEAALLFQDAAVREAAKAGTAPLIEATIQRAQVSVRRGDHARAIADLDQVDRQLVTVPPGGFRSYMSAEIQIVRAQLPGDDTSAANLQDAIGFFSKAEPGRVPGLYLLLARTAQSQASAERSEAALRSGIDRLEAQQAGLGDEALKISFFDDSWALFQDMVALQLARNDSAKAFEYAERSRARSLLAAAQGSKTSYTRLLPDIQAQLPPSMVLVHYSTLADRILIWTITTSDAKLVERAITERDLARLLEQHRASIHDHRENRGANDRLYALLVEPIATRMSPATVVVLVPDGRLQQLSFATLRHPSTRRYLIEDHALMVSPSATFFVDARAATSTRTGTPLESALLVGNPTADGARTLPGAESEVAAASQLYPKHEVLTGRLATKSRFLEMAPRFEVVHFGGHAFANPEFPLLSRLVFAGEAGADQSLFAHEIARVRFPRTRVVVLAACSTAAGAVSRGEGVVSVARPFLAGGVPLVVASQWDVDDRATERLTLAFHRALAKSGDPVQALQVAQLALLRSGDAVQALPESWGAFVAVGTAAREASR